MGSGPPVFFVVAFAVIGVVLAGTVVGGVIVALKGGNTTRGHARRRDDRSE